MVKLILGLKGSGKTKTIIAMMNNAVGFGAKLLQIFANQGLSFEHCPTGIDTMSVIVGSDSFREVKDMLLQQIRQELEPEFISVESGLAVIAVVGHGLVSAKGSAASMFRSLAEANINIRMIDQGSSEMNVIIGVDEADYENAIRALYRIF